MLIQNSTSANAHKPRFLMLPSDCTDFFRDGKLKEDWEGYPAGTSIDNIDFSKINSVDVTNMYTMFYNSSFNQDISNWDMSNVTNMRALFGNSPFNQDISNWDTSNVTNMRGIFYNNSSFNQDISNWDTSNVTNMFALFYSSSFNQDISWSSKKPNQWNVSNVIEFTDFLVYNTTFSNSNYDKFLIGLKAQDDAGYTLEEGVQLDAPNQQYGADPDAVTAHDFLTTTRGWTINDAGQVV